MCTIKRLFESLTTGEMVEVKNSPVKFHNEDEARNYVHAMIRNFIERSMDMGTTEDGRVARLPACIEISANGKEVSLHHGSGSIIDTKLVCDFEINPSSCSTKYPHVGSFCYGTIRDDVD